MAASNCAAEFGVGASPGKNGLIAYSANVRATIAAVTGLRTRNVTQSTINAGNGPNASGRLENNRNSYKGHIFCKEPSPAVLS